MKSVSVVIPVLNAGPLLDEVLAGVREQGELELLVIDSGSTRRLASSARARPGRG